MTDGVEEHSKCCPWLELGLGGSEGKNLALADVKVHDVNIDVRLLRVNIAWPHWRDIVVGTLKGHGRAGAHELDPFVVLVIRTDGQSSHPAVERGQRARVGTIEGEDAQLTDSRHDKS